MIPPTSAESSSSSYQSHPYVISRQESTSSTICTNTAMIKQQDCQQNDNNSEEDASAPIRQQKRSRKSVSFEPVTYVYTVESHPYDCYHDLWYSVQEYRQIKRRNLHDVQEAKLSGMDIMFRPFHYRGLERIVDETRKSNIHRSIQAVLMEHVRQQVQDYQIDVEATSEMYQAYCLSSVEKAKRLADMDAQDATLALQASWTDEESDNDDDGITSSLELEEDLSVGSRSDSLRVFQQERVLASQQQQRRRRQRQHHQQDDGSCSSTSQSLWMKLVSPFAKTAIPTCG